jgi:hypothetical protein
MRCKFAAKPGKIESSVDLPHRVIFGNCVPKTKLVEQLTLVTLQTAHHGSTSPRPSNRGRNRDVFLPDQIAQLVGFEVPTGEYQQGADANMLAPIELMKSTIDGMIARKFGRIVNVTSRAVKARRNAAKPS